MWNLWVQFAVTCISVLYSFKITVFEWQTKTKVWRIMKIPQESRKLFPILQTFHSKSIGGVTRMAEWRCSRLSPLWYRDRILGSHMGWVDLSLTLRLFLRCSVFLIFTSKPKQRNDQTFATCKEEWVTTFFFKTTFCNTITIPLDSIKPILCPDSLQ